jgi:hypothetical protein
MELEQPVTIGNLSPTLLDRYVSAAEKISRVAVGRPSRSPGGETIRIPADITQEEHLDVLPIGTRGGAVVHYTFPQDGEYEIQIRLTRDRDEHVEGLGEAHDLELLLDRERVRLFTVKPPVREAGVPEADQPSHAKVDQHLNIRIPVGAGPHALGVAFPKKPSVLLETPRQPYQTHFNSYRHPRIQPAIYSVSIIGPYEARVTRAAADSCRGKGSRSGRPPPDGSETRCPGLSASCDGVIFTDRFSSIETRGPTELRGGHRDGPLGRAGERVLLGEHDPQNPWSTVIASAILNQPRRSRSSSGAVSRTTRCSTSRLAERFTGRSLERQVRGWLIRVRARW